MAKKKKQIDKVVSSSSEFDELRKQNFRLSRRDKMLTDDFLLDSYDLKTHLYGAEFQANSRQLRRGIDGLFVGYPRDLFEQFQQLKLTESDSNRHLVTDEDRNVVDGDTVGDSSKATALAEKEFFDFVLGDMRKKFRLDNSRDPRREEIERLLCSLY